MKKTKFIAAALAVLFVFNTYAIPRSKAVVIDATAAFGAAAATAAINGTTATTLFTGMSTSAATSAMTGLMGEYAVATGAASSGTALAGTIGAGTIVTAAGALVLTAAAGYAVYKFIEWLREEKGLEPGGQSVSVIADSVWFNGDVRFTLYSSDWELLSYGDFFSNDSTVDIDGHVVSCSLVERDGYYFCRYDIDGVSSDTYISQPFISWGFFYNPANSIRTGFCLQLAEDKYTTLYSSSTNVFWAGLTQVDCDLSLQSKAEFTPIPESIPETDAVVITGIDNLPQDDPQAAADAIMQSAIDGVLAPTVSVESDPTVTPDPDPDPEPTLPPDDLPQNLPQLGDVLISRFPFSIPWDIGRVLDFLSAEPVAPHIDFQPFKGDLFGIPAGSVSVDYDFSKHEDIAAFCRTFEIVGFCLLLAVGTKRLIWTA